MRAVVVAKAPAHLDVEFFDRNDISMGVLRMDAESWCDFLLALRDDTDIVVQFPTDQTLPRVPGLTINDRRRRIEEAAEAAFVVTGIQPDRFRELVDDFSVRRFDGITELREWVDAELNSKTDLFDDLQVRWLANHLSDLDDEFRRRDP